MRIFRCKCVFLGVICVFLGGILQNFHGGMHPDPYNVRPKVDLWRHTIVKKLGPPRKFFAYATGYIKLGPLFHSRLHYCILWEASFSESEKKLPLDVTI